MSDILQVFTQTNQKINLLQKKIDAILLRLEICQRNMQKTKTEQGSPRMQNLQSYLANESEVESFRAKPCPTNRVKQQDVMLLSSHHQSQLDKRWSTKFVDKQIKETILDSKSFGAIKRSILINSEEIEHMKERVLSFEKEYIQKIISLEEGVQILTRLCSLIDQKVTDFYSENQIQAVKGKPKSPNLNKAYQTHKIVQKYMRDTQIDKARHSSSPVFKYL